MNPNDTLLKEADRCVKCGICLPHCPTYTLTLDEGDSPRGRISLIQGIASGALDMGRAGHHLDRCLGCLACQAACPSGVDYSQLIDGIREQQKPNRVQQWIHHLITHLPYQTMGRLGLWIYRHAGLRFLLRGIGGQRMQRLDALLPEQARVGNWKRRYAPIGEKQGRVGLFTGCVGRISDQQALDAAIAVLTSLGYEVIVPGDQGCCGALQQHSGNPKAARSMGDINHKAFAGQGLDVILYLASGCGAQLATQTMEVPALEVSQFLNRCHWPESVQLHPLASSVGLHSPCTLKHQLKLADEPAKLLLRIPDIRLTRLDHITCCGAAGSYLLEQPEMSDTLAAQATRRILEQNLHYLATSNSGCALQIAKGIRNTDRPIRVVHPIQLIYFSLNGRGDQNSPEY